MIPEDVLREIVQKTESKIVLLVIDGLGGLPREPGGTTELEAARKPNMNALARRSDLGLLDMVATGVTPGSGAGHLALFGYDPVRYQIGRGVLSAVGIGFDVGPDDLCVRGNFCTLDDRGVVVDRRAGRMPTSLGRELCALLESKIPELSGAKVFVRPEKEYRFVLVFRKAGLGDNITDTDPQKEGRLPLPARGGDPASAEGAALCNAFVQRAGELLKGRAPANGILLRGYAKLPNLEDFQKRYRLTPAVVGTYPMYRGLAKLVGMDVLPTSEEEDLPTLARVLKEHWGRYDFFFIHVKKADSYGEDGDFDKKVQVIEKVDAVLLPAILDLGPDVLAITGDHSTPAVLKAHSWHPVPVLVAGRAARPTAAEFGETECARGSLGRLPATDLMGLLLANAGKLAKFGA